MTKSPDAFRTISEVSEELDLPQHVLRFWETRFSQIKPMKRGGGRRYYRPDDVELLAGIRHLLYDEGYTIRGVQRLLKENGNQYVIAFGRGETPQPAAPAPEPAKERNIVVDTGSDDPQQAVPVSEYGKSEEPKSKGKGLLGRLRGGDPAAADAQEDLSLTGDDRRSLQATLYELLECKRLLDQVR